MTDSEASPLSAADRELLDAMSRGGYVSLATRRAVIDLVDLVAALQAQVDELSRERELLLAFAASHWGADGVLHGNIFVRPDCRWCGIIKQVDELAAASEQGETRL